MTHFLKQLTEDTITHKRLLIPAEFVKRCGRGNLTNPLVLEPTVGGEPREMELELYEDRGGLWLRNGWEEFVNQYSLSHGYYLVFEYRSYSRFKVVMFDGNGLWLEFPASSSPKVGSNGNQGFPDPVEEDEDSVNAQSVEVEILGSSFVKEMNNHNEGGVKLRSAENSKQKEPMRARKRRRRADFGTQRKVNEEAPMGNRANGGLFGKDKDENFHIPPVAEQEAYSKRPSSSKHGRPTATEAVDIDIDLAKFTGLPLRKDMNYNNEFMRTSERKRRRTTEGGQKMGVNREATRKNGGNGSPFGRDKAKNTHIPSMEDEPAFSKRPSSSKCGRPTPTTEAADASTSQPQPLQVIIRKSCLTKGGLGIRREFFDRHIPDWSGKTVVLQVGEAKWPVKIVQTTAGYPYLSQGWRAFAQDNYLIEGDTLVFVPSATADVLGVDIQRYF